MILKTSLFLLLILEGFAAKSQIFLNADSTQINTQILSQGGRLVVNKLEDGFEMPGYYHLRIYKFPKSLVKKKWDR
jgi:hypothetical protein